MAAKTCGCASSFSEQIFSAHDALSAAARDMCGVSSGVLPWKSASKAFTLCHSSQTTCCFFKEAVACAVRAVGTETRKLVTTYGPVVVDEVEIIPLDVSSTIQGFVVRYNYAHAGSHLVDTIESKL